MKMHAFLGMAKNFFRHFILNMIIHPRLTKFSSAYAKGSLAQRFAAADKINNKIFGNTVKLYQGKRNNYPADIIEDCYNFCTPENKNVAIVPLKDYGDDDLAGGTRVVEKMGMYVGYAMELPVTKNDKISIRTLPTLMHESTHVLDFLLNPKFLRSERAFFDNPLSHKFVKFYEKYFYNEGAENVKPEDILKTAEHATSKFINLLPFSTKIVFLKFIRFSMQMEEHAYKQDYHYAKILKKLGKKVNQEELSDFGKELMLSEKIKIVENLLAQSIKEEREETKLLQKIKNYIYNQSNTNV